jgi:hypothetical protein
VYCDRHGDLTEGAVWELAPLELTSLESASDGSAECLL